MKLEDLMHNGLKSKRVPVYSNNRMIGKCIYLKENKQEHLLSTSSFINGIAFGVIGTSSAFQHTLEEIKLVSPLTLVYMCAGNRCRERICCESDS